jgi:acyl carrier protein
MDQIEGKIHEFIVKDLLWEKQAQLDSETQLLEEGIIDSIGLFRMVTFLEETFRIRVPDEDLLAENFQSIHRIAEYVSHRLNSKKGRRSV